MDDNATAFKEVWGDTPTNLVSKHMEEIAPEQGETIEQLAERLYYEQMQYYDAMTMGMDYPRFEYLTDDVKQGWYDSARRKMETGE